jgi:iron complex outermembrane recepter protein
MARTVRSRFGLLIALFALAPLACLAQTATFNLPAQPLAESLKAVGAQTNVNVMVSPPLVDGKQAPPLKANLSVKDALAKLLAGTGLEYHFVNDQTVVIRPKSAVAAVSDPPAGQPATNNPQDTKETGKNSSQDFRVAQVDQTPAGNQTVGNTSANAQANQPQPTPATMPEILIVGSHSLDVDIPRTRDDAMPYVVFNSQEIEDSQATNLEDFFRKRLTMDTQSQASNQNALLNSNPFLGNMSSITLRGLGANQTLILIDGRRAPRVLSGGMDFSQADINGIPLASIERIEILPSSAGGIYGGGAVGGVINIIRKRDYHGFDIKAGYDGVFGSGSDGRTYRIDLSGGFSLEGGKTQVMLSASQADTNPFFAGDNDLYRRGRELYVTNVLSPAVTAQGFTSPVSGYTPNIQAASVYNPVCNCSTIPNLVLNDGTPLNSNHTFVPVGYAGVAANGTAALLANAGKYNLQLPNDGTGTDADLLAASRLRSANLNIRRAFGSAVDAFADFTVNDNLERADYYFGNLSNYLPAGSPDNPFRQDIVVALPILAGNFPSITRSETWLGTAGVIVRLGGSWTATAEYDWSRSRNEGTYTNYPLSAGASAAVANGTINLIQDVNAHPINYSPYLLPTPDSAFGPFDTTQQIVSLRASGSLYDLPGGALNLTMLAEHRRDQTGMGGQELQAGFPPAGPFTLYFPAASQAVQSGYAELRAPLVSERNQVPFVHDLELQISGRYDGYTTRAASPPSVYLFSPTDTLPEFLYSSVSVHSTDYTLALRWAPIKDLSFRASYSTGFLPPSISQIVPGQPSPFPGSSGYLDPLRGNEPVGSRQPFELASGGNPDLTPELSKSLSLGVILTPGFADGLRLSTDYTRIRKSDEITLLDPQTLLNEEATFPGLIVRGPKLPGDPPSWPGPVILIKDYLVNIAKSSVEAYDLSAEYLFDTVAAGHFHLYAVATRQTQFERQLVPGSAPYDSVGFSDGPLEWRGNAGLDWTMSHWSMGWNAQYYSSYNIGVSNASPAFNAFAYLLQGSDRIPSQTYHDLNVRYHFSARPSSWLDNLVISGGIQNVFDTHPPPIAAPVNGYSTYGDPRLRRYSLTVAKHF